MWKERLDCSLFSPSTRERGGGDSSWTVRFTSSASLNKLLSKPGRIKMGKHGKNGMGRFERLFADHCSHPSYPYSPFQRPSSSPLHSVHGGTSTVGHERKRRAHLRRVKKRWRARCCSPLTLPISHRVTRSLPLSHCSRVVSSSFVRTAFFKFSPACTAARLTPRHIAMKRKEWKNTRVRNEALFWRGRMTIFLTFDWYIW